MDCPEQRQSVFVERRLFMRRRIVVGILFGALLAGISVFASGCGSSKKTLDLFTKMELAMGGLPVDEGGA